jgi:hypothetical protein
MYVPKTMIVQLVLGALVLVVLLHMYMSVRYGYDWIGTTTRKAFHRQHAEGASVTDLYPIPATPYMDRFGAFTKVPRMKHNTY